MEKYILSNGVRLVYEYRTADITSFCIGYNAGAIEENDEFNLGTAHAVEHMISKGTKNRTEKEINELCDEIFGFENAMTNFPYVIYYGTLLTQDFERGFELFSDMLLNAAFPEEGFKEEISIILEELKEWKDDIYQYCEDCLLKNAFNKKRIKELIIGTEKSIKSFTLEEIKKFYKKYYVPENCVISVCSSLSFEEVLSVVEKYFKDWNESFCDDKEEETENNIDGIYTEKIHGINGAKIKYLYNIDTLDEKEIKNLMVFNAAFGEGTNSILFEEIRTKRGLAYDVGSGIKNERGIKFFSINLATSEEKLDEAIKVIEASIRDVKDKVEYFNNKKILSLKKNIKLKRQIKLEKSIQLCKELTTYELMYDDSEKVYDEVINLDCVSGDKILEVINKVLNKPTVQILLPFKY